MNFEQVCELARSTVVAGAIRNFHESGVVQPVSFIVGFRDMETGAPLAQPVVHIVSLVEVAHDKDLLRATQQQLCDQAGAVAHIYVTEGWLVFMEDDGSKITDPYAEAQVDSLADHPDRVESVFIVLEHRDGGAFWRIPILRDGDHASLGEVDEQLSGLTEGRMTGYIKGGRPKVEA